MLEISHFTTGASNASSAQSIIAHHATAAISLTSIPSVTSDFAHEPGLLHCIPAPIIASNTDFDFSNYNLPGASSVCTNTYDAIQNNTYYNPPSASYSLSLNRLQHSVLTSNTQTRKNLAACLPLDHLSLINIDREQSSPDGNLPDILLHDGTNEIPFNHSSSYDFYNNTAYLNNTQQPPQFFEEQSADNDVLRSTYALAMTANAAVVDPCPLIDWEDYSGVTCSGGLGEFMNPDDWGNQAALLLSSSINLGPLNASPPALSRHHSVSRGASPLEQNCKVEVMYSLLNMIGTHNKEEMSQTLLAMSSCPESCPAMRHSGCMNLLIQILHGSLQLAEGLDEEDEQCYAMQRGSKTARRRAAQALINLVHYQADERRSRREARVLRLLEQIRAYCDQLIEFRINVSCSKSELPYTDNDMTNELCGEERLMTTNANDYLTMNDIIGLEYQPGPAVAALMKLSFDEDHRQAICNLGGLHAVADLLRYDYEAHGNTNASYPVSLRRYTCMALTNLTFGDGTNKSLLCSMTACLQTLVAQLQSVCEDLRQVAASVLRNLSWHADTPSKLALHKVATASNLMSAVISCKRESTLKSALSALWNISSHSQENKVEICQYPNGLHFLLSVLLTYKSSSKTMTIVENGTGILRNVSNVIAGDDALRQILRDNKTFDLLVRLLQSPSLTVVSNAVGIICNLSGFNCSQDQQTLCELGVVTLLKSLVHSKHKMISVGAAAALRNLLSFRPDLDSPSSSRLSSKASHNGSGTSTPTKPDYPTLHIRRQRALQAVSDVNDILSIQDNAIGLTNVNKSGDVTVINSGNNNASHLPTPLRNNTLQSAASWSSSFHAKHNILDTHLLVTQASTNLSNIDRNISINSTICDNVVPNKLSIATDNSNNADAVQFKSKIPSVVVKRQTKNAPDGLILEENNNNDFNANTLCSISSRETSPNGYSMDISSKMSSITLSETTLQAEDTASNSTKLCLPQKASTNKLIVNDTNVQSKLTLQSTTDVRKKVTTVTDNTKKSKTVTAKNRPIIDNIPVILKTYMKTPVKKVTAGNNRSVANNAGNNKQIKSSVLDSDEEESNSNDPQNEIRRRKKRQKWLKQSTDKTNSELQPEDKASIAMATHGGAFSTLNTLDIPPSCVMQHDNMTAQRGSGGTYTLLSSDTIDVPGDLDVHDDDVMSDNNSMAVMLLSESLEVDAAACCKDDATENDSCSSLDSDDMDTNGGRLPRIKETPEELDGQGLDDLTDYDDDDDDNSESRCHDDNNDICNKYVPVENNKVTTPIHQTTAHSLSRLPRLLSPITAPKISATLNSSINKPSIANIQQVNGKQNYSNASQTANNKSSTETLSTPFSSSSNNSHHHVETSSLHDSIFSKHLEQGASEVLKHLEFSKKANNISDNNNLVPAFNSSNKSENTLILNHEKNVASDKNSESGDEPIVSPESPVRRGPRIVKPVCMTEIIETPKLGGKGVQRAKIIGDNSSTVGNTLVQTMQVSKIDGCRNQIMTETLPKGIRGGKKVYGISKGQPSKLPQRSQSLDSALTTNRTRTISSATTPFQCKPISTIVKPIVSPKLSSKPSQTVKPVSRLTPPNTSKTTCNLPLINITFNSTSSNHNYSGNRSNSRDASKVSIPSNITKLDATKNTANGLISAKNLPTAKSPTYHKSMSLPAANVQMSPSLSKRSSGLNTKLLKRTTVSARQLSPVKFDIKGSEDENCLVKSCHSEEDVWICRRNLIGLSEIASNNEVVLGTKSRPISIKTSIPMSVKV